MKKMRRERRKREKAGGADAGGQHAPRVMPRLLPGSSVRERERERERAFLIPWSTLRM